MRRAMLSLQLSWNPVLELWKLKKMLKDEPFRATFRFDTAENELCEVEHLMISAIFGKLVMNKFMLSKKEKNVMLL